MRRGYGQFCPVAKACELLCERWTVLVVRELVAGSQRFNDLRRGLPLMSPTLLSTRLKQLVQTGVIHRVVDEAGGAVYELTQAGGELRTIVEQMGVWGHRWVGSQLEETDLDVGLLMWDIRRGVDAAQFPENRVTVQFEFSDAPKGMVQWWLVSESRDVDLCRQNPGYEVDLLLQSPVRVLTDIWLCRRPFLDAERRGEVHVMGDSHLRKKLSAWLQGSPIAKLGDASLKEVPVGQA